MVPVIALVGRPNVGKSTLFNRLTRSRDALVADHPGLTRDRQYGFGAGERGSYIVIDTGGLASSDDRVELAAQSQTLAAIAEADGVIFIVDAREGLLPDDSQIAATLRTSGKPMTVAVNKSEGVAIELAAAEFHQLGLGNPLPIAAVHGQRIDLLMAAALGPFVDQMGEAAPDEIRGMEVAVVGRPNVGKSTLINRLLGEDRVVTSDRPGTTRDSVRVSLKRRGEDYTLIDTAGVRRRARVDDVIEKWSVVQTLKAIDQASVVIVLLDARQGVTDQDLRLIGLVIDRGRPLTLGINKWDGLRAEQRHSVNEALDRTLDFTRYVQIEHVSALHGSGIDELLDAARAAHEAGQKDLSTADLNRVLEGAQIAHPPPLVRGRRIRLRYAHQGGRRPPLIVVHGNQTGRLPDHYRRYLSNTFRKAFHLEGTPIRLQFKQGSNPYAGKRNVLTPRQQRRRQRLIRHGKGKRKGK